MTARGALLDGISRLGARPAATGGALVAGAAAALALEAGSSAAGSLWRAGLEGRAILAWLVAGIVAALVGAGGLAAAVSAAGGDGGARLPRVVLPRGVAILTLRAVERVLLFSLVLAAAAPALRAIALGRSPAATAFAVAAALLAPSLMAALVVAAFDVAVARAAAGRPAAEALGDGARFTFSHFPSLVRLGALLVVATAPLWIAGALVGREGAGPAAATIATALRGALAMAAAAIGAVSIARLVESEST